MTQHELARAAGFDSQYVSRWERAKVLPTLNNLARLGEVLERDVSWFYASHEPNGDETPVAA